LAKLQAALTRRLERTQAQTMALDQHLEAIPDHIVEALGTPPEHPFALERWRRTADSIDRYRHGNGITAPDDALGPKPHRGAAQREWLRLTHEIERARSGLERTLDRDRDVGS
jgi:hypothetical protein